MEVMQLYSVLAATINADATQRHAAEETLKQHQHTPGQLTNLLRVAVEDTVDPAVRQVAAITFKNLVKADWMQDEAGTSPLAEADKAAVRENLLEGIVRAPHAVQVQLAECAKYVVYADYPERWPSLLPAIGAHLATQEQQRLYGGLLMVRLLARKYEFKDDDEREPLAHIVSATFPALLAIFQALLAANSPAVEVAELLKLVCKTFWSATYMEIPAQLAEPAAFAGWMTALHTFVSQPVPEAGQPEDSAQRQAWPWWKAKKWALHISHRLFNRYGDPKKCDKDSPDAAFAAQFRDTCSVKFLEAHAALLGRYAEGQWLSPRVVNLTLQYLTVGIKQARTWKLLAPHVPALMQRVLFPLMCFGDEDAELWDDDPQEYIRKGYDIMEEMYSPKSAASNFLHELCESRQKNLGPFMQQISAIFTEYQAAAAGGATVPQGLARRMDGALLAVGALSDILKQKEPYKKELEGMLMTHVAPLFRSPHGHLRAKAAWVSGVYADIKFAGGYGGGAHFQALFRAIVAALADTELPVRVDAVMATRAYIDSYSAESVDEIKGLIPALLDQIFKLMAEVDNEDLVLTLEAIVDKFEEEMAPFAVGLTQHLAQAFWRAVAAEDAADGEDDGLAAYNTLRTLATVLESVSSQPALFPQLEEVVFPIMARMISSEGQDVFEEVLELLAYLTYCSPAISPRLWSLWPQLAACLNDWAVDFFENVLVVLDNFISRGTDTFLACKQPDYLASVNQMAERFLMDDQVDEADLMCAPKLMEVVLQNCRGRVDACVAPYLQLSLQRLSNSRKKLMQDLLLNVVASAFFYNAPLAMGALRGANAVQPAFTVWLAGINGSGKRFRRLYDKKVQILGLLAVLTLPDSDMTPEVAAGAPDLLAATVKLLSAYREQQTLAELEDSDDESVEDSEVDSDEGEDVDFDEIDAREEGQGNGLRSDEDAAEEAGDAYMERLARIRERIKAGGGHEESDDDSEWTEDEEVSTPVDPVDPFMAFSDAVRLLQQQHSARFQALASGRGQEHAAAVTGLLQHAEAVRAKKASEEAAAAQAAAAGQVPPQR